MVAVCCPWLAGVSREGKEVVFSQGGVEPEACTRAARDYEGRIPAFYHGKQETLLQFPEALQRAHMVRSLTHKLIYRISGAHELYDLREDPDELSNRYADPAMDAVRRDLERRLLNFLVRYQCDSPPIYELWA